MNHSILFARKGYRGLWLSKGLYKIAALNTSVEHLRLLKSLNAKVGE